MRAPAQRRVVPRHRLPARSEVATRLDPLDWKGIDDALWERGWVTTGVPILHPGECADLVALYPDDSRCRSRVDMERLRFGSRLLSRTRHSLGIIFHDAR